MLIDFFNRVIDAKTHPHRRVWYQVAVQNLRAVMTRTNGNIFSIKQCRNIVRMNSSNREAENRDALPRVFAPRIVSLEYFSALKHAQGEFALVFSNRENPFVR